MAIDIAGALSAQSSSLTNSKATIADNFDTFLTLLTTQLKNQNPLEPMDSNEFTAQIVQFTAVEQQLKMNEQLETLIALNYSSSQNEAMAFVGLEVVASGSQTKLENGSATWNFSLDDNAPTAEFSIRNEQGDIVRTETRALTAGSQKYIWDGHDANGLAVQNGDYSLTIDARDGDGNYIPTSTQTHGIVSGIDFSSLEPLLLIGNSQIKLSSVLSANVPQQ